jgi:hypothetical protein
MKPLEGKTAVCFSGRVHHAEKLCQLMTYLLQHGGLNVRYVTSAFNSYNVDSFERPLRDKGLPYDLIQDWMTADLVEEMNRLNTPVQHEITRRMFEDDHNILDTVSSIWTRDAFRDTIECYVLFRQYLQDVRPDVIFILHEANFWTKILAYWGRQLDIPVISFQEGMYRPPGDSQYMRNLFGNVLADYSTKVCLWGDYSKAIFRDCGVPEDKLTVVGAPHLDEFLPIDHDERQRIRAKVRHELGIGDDRKVILLLLSLSRYWVGDLVNDVRLVGEYVRKQPNMALIVKWHPLEHGELVKQVQGLLEPSEPGLPMLDTLKELPIIHQHEHDLMELIQASDLTLIQNSTSGLECLVFGVPLVELNLDSKPIEHSYYSDGVAERIHHPRDLPQLAKFADGYRQRVIPGMVDRYLHHLLFALDGSTQKRILDVVKDLLLPS